MSNKPLVDAVGSVDDFGVESGFDPATLGSEPEKDPCEGEVKVGFIWEKEGHSMLGHDNRPLTEVQEYHLEERQLKDGRVLKTVYPLRPFCKWCSPASKRADDQEWTSGWSEDGAEVRMSKRDARLAGVAYDNYYSFTLVERQGQILCSKCEQSPDSGEDYQTIQVITSDPQSDPAVFNPEAVLLGIRVERQVARIPEQLMTLWAERKQLSSGDFVLAHDRWIFSIPCEDLLKSCVWDETNSEWLLGLAKCQKAPALVCSLSDGEAVADLQTVLDWRKTALSVKSIVAVSGDGLTYTTDLQSFLAGGRTEGAKWKYPLEGCEGPYFKTVSDLVETSNPPSSLEVEARTVDSKGQTNLFGF